MTSKQRAMLVSLAAEEATILHIGKAGISPALTANVEEALAARELIKIGVQQNNADDIRAQAELLAERTQSEVVKIIGRKIILYREGEGKHRQILLPE